LRNKYSLLSAALLKAFKEENVF